VGRVIVLVVTVVAHKRVQLRQLVLAVGFLRTSPRRADVDIIF
jgi:hypothetical protein